MFVESALIQELIKYKKVIGHPFPFSSVKEFDKEEIIKRIKFCIENKTYYDYKLFKCDDFCNMSNNDFKSIIPKVRETMESLGFNYDKLLNNYKKEIIKRKKGKKVFLKVEI